ncbi:ribokinase [soil metagenome]
MSPLITSPSGGSVGRVVVVGSANVDRTLMVDRFPEPGETIMGAPVVVGQGGKGANQAVAASRMGARVAFVGAVGQDDDGQAVVDALAAEGVDVEAVTRVNEPTGAAFICVDAQAENMIVVSPGANATLSAATIKRHRQIVATAAVVLVQLEVPLDVVRAALEAGDGLSILNPAPASRLPSGILELADVLVPNRGELGALAGVDTPVTTQDVVRTARTLPVDRVVVTLGSDGAVAVQGPDVEVVPAIDVDPVDTTGAGDAFCGALAAGLSRGDELDTAVRAAVTAAGLSTTGAGARGALPTRAEVDHAVSFIHE